MTSNTTSHVTHTTAPNPTQPHSAAQPSATPLVGAGFDFRALAGLLPSVLPAVMQLLNMLAANASGAAPGAVSGAAAVSEVAGKSQDVAYEAIETLGKALDHSAATIQALHAQLHDAFQLNRELRAENAQLRQRQDSLLDALAGPPVHSPSPLRTNGMPAAGNAPAGSGTSSSASGSGTRVSEKLPT